MGFIDFDIFMAPSFRLTHVSFPFLPPLPIEYANIDWNDEGFLEANGDRRLLK